MSTLAHEKCLPANEANRDALTVGLAERETLLAQLSGWHVLAEGAGLCREFRFKNYYHVMAFVNAIAWIANKEAHHPDLEVSYGRVKVLYTTHDLGGLSRNDFICAAKIDALLAVGDFGPVLA
ncbi:MAG: 4a-hydroxytetrahydrobiopterin dehydratase [Gammaproteobacteria bacterium]|nr:4a-hydroxytetrahydrobiopterin dehydratase [Gammaproteobacteria bacterium]